MIMTHEQWLVDYAHDVVRWLDRLYGKHTCPKRRWLEQAAVAIATETTPPPAPKEGNTDREWRAASARLDTLTRMYDTHRKKAHA